jgi:hypothetical protein
MNDGPITLKSPDTPELKVESRTACLVLMRTAQPSATPSKPITQTPVSNTMRATTITVVLEEILTHSGYVHGGINE